MFTPPTLNELITDLRQSVKAEWPSTNPWIWPNNLVPLLKAFAQALRAAYLRLGFIHEQAFVSTARGEYLDFHGIQTGGLSRNPAQFAAGSALFTGTLGSVVPDGTQLRRDDGILYTTVGTSTLIVSPTGIYVKAVEPGELGNSDPSAPLTLVDTVIGITDVIAGTDGILGGMEEETDDSFRQRILFQKQNPPHGGTPLEYIEWCQTKPGVTRAFPQRATPQPGSVTVYFMMDGVGTGIPSVSDVAELQGIIEQLAPSDADVQIRAPTLQTVNVTISGLVPDTAEIRNALTEEIKAQFVRRAEPASVLVPFTFAKAWIDEACSMTPKWKRSTTTIPAADVVVTTPGAIPVFGTVTFI